MRKTLAALILSSTLFGCGGSNTGNGVPVADGSNTENGIPSADVSEKASFTYRAIDGYLGSAEVYVDRNSNMEADNDEYIGLTSNSGEILIKKSDSDYDIIVRIIAGQTTDSDINSTVNYSKEMISDRGQRTITPFSTLAKLQGLTLKEMADILNLDYEDISTDYVANDAALVHAVARSLQILLQTKLADNMDEIAGIQSKATQISDYLKNVKPEDMTNIVIEIDSDGQLIESTIDQVHRKPFNIGELSVAWEQKDFSQLIYEQGNSPQGFHPCYMQKWGDVLLVSNCRSSKLITLDIKTGTIVSESAMLIDMDQPQTLYWFLDGQYVGLMHSDKSVSYLDKSLQPILPAKSELKYTENSLIALGERGVLNNGYHFSVEYGTQINQEHILGEASFYDEQNGQIITFQSDASSSETESVTAETILQAIDAVSGNFEGGWVPKSDMKITWITDDSFIVRLDTSGSNGYVSKDYHYLYKSGEISYLGHFFQGDWRIGLDNSTVVHYSSYKASDAPDHEMRQF
ncbi:MAG: hypothetical protein VX212_03060, partial [Pseudomonadota bacterium]|nr:hypothetical protein [Pseudomonadota bacterium]